MIDKIKQLREETGVSITECKNALTETKGSIDKAKEVLRKKGMELAKKKKDRTTSQGIIDCYIHPNKKIGVLLELNCETDFVAKGKDFQSLAHELCLQIAGVQQVDDEKTPLLQQPWVKDESKTVKELVDEYIAKLGENITVKRFVRYQI